MKPLHRYFRRIASSLLKRFHIATNAGYSVSESYGLRFLFDWRHSIDKKVALQLYEDEQIPFFRETIWRFKPDYFFDVGSHSGLYALLARQASEDTRVHAFEPDKQNLSQLYANLYLNNYYDLIDVHNLALSNITGHAFLERSANTSRGTRHLSADGNYRVDSERFDNLFADAGKAAYFKIDIEGHELQMIEGASAFLKNNRCIVLVECAQEKIAILQNKMTDLGFAKKIIPVNKLDHVFANFDFPF